MSNLNRLSLVKLRSESQAREQKEKAIERRKRGILVLVADFLIGNGYLETAQKLQIESSVSMDKFQVADNIDLTAVVQQFEEFHEMKFGKSPKLFRKSDGGGLPPPSCVGAASRRQKGKMAAKAKKGEQVGENPNAPKAGRNNTEAAPGSLEPVSVSGTTIGQHPRVSVEASYEPEIRLLKPLPDYGSNTELRDLAALISRDIYLDNPNVHWDDIAELQSAKQLLTEAIVMPLRFPCLFTGLLRPWKGVLLHGPSGVGKTLLARAIATECRTTFFNVSASSIVSKWRGDSEKLVRILFELARYHSPSTIFIDELDALMSSRSSSSEHEASRRMKTELLIQMDGLAKSDDLVFVLGASNTPWDLDMAILRRLEKRILVPLPNSIARAKIVRQHLDVERAPDIDVDEVAERTKGFSGADVLAVCKEAAMRPLRKLMSKLDLSSEDSSQMLDAAPSVSPSDVEAALSCIRPSSSAQVVERYEQWQSEHGSGVVLHELDAE